MGILDALKIRHRALMGREKKKLKTNYAKMKTAYRIRRTSKKSQQLLMMAPASTKRRRSRSSSRSATSKNRKYRVRASATSKKGSLA